MTSINEHYFQYETTSYGILVQSHAGKNTTGISLQALIHQITQQKSAFKNYWAIFEGSLVGNEPSPVNAMQLGLQLAQSQIQAVWTIGSTASDIAEHYAKNYSGMIACFTEIQGLQGALPLALGNEPTTDQGIPTTGLIIFESQTKSLMNLVMQVSQIYSID